MLRGTPQELREHRRERGKDVHGSLRIPSVESLAYVCTSDAETAQGTVYDYDAERAQGSTQEPILCPAPRLPTTPRPQKAVLDYEDRKKAVFLDYEPEPFAA